MALLFGSQEGASGVADGGDSDVAALVAAATRAMHEAGQGLRPPPLELQTGQPRQRRKTGKKKKARPAGTPNQHISLGALCGWCNLTRVFWGGCAGQEEWQPAGVALGGPCGAAGAAGPADAADAAGAQGTTPEEHSTAAAGARSPRTPDQVTPARATYPAVGSGSRGT